MMVAAQPITSQTATGEVPFVEPMAGGGIVAVALNGTKAIASATAAATIALFIESPPLPET